jgi:hypothetical protein
MIDRTTRAIVNTPDAGQYVIPHKLVENLTIQDKIVPRFGINQSVINN